MIKNKKGIALVTVMVSILVMILILSTIVVSANGIIENTRKKQFARELYLVQSRMDTYIARNSGRISSGNTVEIVIADLEQGGVLQFSEEIPAGGKFTLKEIDLYEIDVESVTFGNKKEGNKDRYLVSISSGKVYYEKGFKVGGITYYTLTDELKKTK